MKNKDWIFSDDENICNFRSAGVLIVNNQVLIQREKNGMEYSLPGGHVNIGETSEQAIIREFKEETGANIICERMLWVDESFWKWGNKNAHTIAFYYLVSLKKDSTILNNGEFFSQKDNCDVVLQWMPIKNIKDITIYPDFLKNKIENMSNNIEHFIYKE